jgi:drug/metabolite transporter (DMT)-like permease
MNPARLRAYIALLIATIIWGLAGPIIKYTLGRFDSVTFLAYRYLISTVVGVITFAILGFHLPKERKTLGELLLYGFVTSTVALGFLFFGLENTTVLDMSLITLANPLVITIAGVWFLRENVTKKEKLGMAIALIGTLLTVIEPLIQNHGGSIRISGNILIVGYLLATGWSAVLVKRLLRENVSPITMTNASFIIGFLSFLPFALIKFNMGSFLQVPFSYHLGVLYMALLSGSLAYYLSNKAQKTIEIGDASIFAYLYPLFSTPLAVLWLGEKITPMFVVGAVIIAMGVVIAEMKKKSYN